MMTYIATCVRIHTIMWTWNLVASYVVWNILQLPYREVCLNIIFIALIADEITLNINCFDDNNCESKSGVVATDFRDCCTEKLGFSYQDLSTDTCMICPGLEWLTIYV